MAGWARKNNSRRCAGWPPPTTGRDEIRATLTDPTLVNYTRFETHVLQAPWHRGRVVLIGDAAHSCPPILAQGGA